MRSFDQRAVDVHEAEQLQQHHQRQAQGEVTHIAAKGGIEHGQRANPQQRQGAIEQPLVTEKDLPGIGAHQVTGKKNGVINISTNIAGLIRGT